jgi:hypothetical protein
MHLLIPLHIKFWCCPWCEKSVHHVDGKACRFNGDRCPHCNQRVAKPGKASIGRVLLYILLFGCCFIVLGFGMEFLESIHNQSEGLIQGITKILLVVWPVAWIILYLRVHIWYLTQVGMGPKCQAKYIKKEKGWGSLGCFIMQKIPEGTLSSDVLSED